MLIIWGSIAGYVAAFAPLLYGNILAGYNWKLAFVLCAFRDHPITGSDNIRSVIPI